MSEIVRNMEVRRTTSTAHKLTQYDGECSMVHGHNLEWNVRVSICLADSGESNMPVDLKDVSETIDFVDHACLLNESDDLISELVDVAPEQLTEQEERHGYNSAYIDEIGRCILFGSDPTCEMLNEWMGNMIYDLSEAIVTVNLELRETEKYGVSGCYTGVER